MSVDCTLFTYRNNTDTHTHTRVTLGPELPKAFNIKPVRMHGQAKAMQYQEEYLYLGGSNHQRYYRAAKF